MWMIMTIAIRMSLPNGSTSLRASLVPPFWPSKQPIGPRRSNGSAATMRNGPGADREITNLAANSGPKEPLSNDRVRQILETLDRTRTVANWAAPGGGLSVKLRIQTIEALAKAFHDQDEAQHIPTWAQGDPSRGFPRTFL